MEQKSTEHKLNNLPIYKAIKSDYVYLFQPSNETAHTEGRVIGYNNYISLTNSRPSLDRYTDSSWDWKADNYELSLASTEDSEWFKECIEANKIIPKDKWLIAWQENLKKKQQQEANNLFPIY